MWVKRIAIGLLSLAISACGGGGGGGGSGASNPAPAPTPTSPPEAPTFEALADSARFANLSTFGLAFPDIEKLAEIGNSTWLQQQFELPIGLHSPTVDEFVARRDAGEFEDFEEDVELLTQFRRLAWWHCAVTCEDLVRQRAAFALSEIFVVSDTVDALIVYPYALSTYYDTLLKNAFGNYRDLLREVALHPAMGFYLSHINNKRSNPEANTFPDENFAREVMQLFSIGLFELNLDGSHKRDANGNSIPTYDNVDIREFAKIFTGLSWGDGNGFTGDREPNFRLPMRMYDPFHEPGEKNLLNGVIVPAGQTAAEDFEMAIDTLFNHPNVGPFIGKQLIQRLVTSNPSPGYIERVSAAFENDGSGQRGNLKAVFEAILNDAEASPTVDPDTSFGKMREPVVRHLNLLRIFGAKTENGFIASSGYLLQLLGGQHPLSSPSVFNFFLPSHSPTGAIANAGLVAPEFQIVNSGTVVNMANLLDFALFGDFVTDASPPFENATLQLDEYVNLAEDVNALMQRLDILLTNGNLSEGTAQAIRNILLDIPDTSTRARTAIYMFMISADYVVRN